MPKIFYFIISEARQTVRLDKFLANQLKQSLISREKIKKAILQGKVKVNEKIVNSPNFSLNQNSEICFSEATKNEIKINPADIELNIIFEDNDIIIINKQAGLTVHPGAGNQNNTLVNALIARNSNLSTISGAERPGIVHRLDKNTSGLMIIAKNDQAHLHLTKQLQDRSLSRKYYALIWGMLNPEQGVIENSLARSSRNRKLIEVTLNKGKKAITLYQTKKNFFNGAISLIECQLKTGRTHQIRVHMSNLGHPILGDPEYGNNQKKLNRYFNHKEDEILFNFQRQALHAFYLSFIHPTKNKLYEFSLELPEDMLSIIKQLKQKN